MAEAEKRPKTIEQQVNDLVAAFKRRNDKFGVDDEKLLRKQLTDGEAATPGFIAALDKYYNARHRLVYSFDAEGLKRHELAGNIGGDPVDLQKKPSLEFIRKSTAEAIKAGDKNIERYSAKEEKDNKDMRAKGWKDSSEGTRKEVVKLLREDKTAKALAEIVQKTKAPKDFAKLVAYLETKIEKLKYDVPGWEGNELFRGWIVSKEKYTQDGCTTESLQIRKMVGALRDEKILPEAHAFGVNGGGHSALAVCLDNAGSSFIIDGWLAKTGVPAPTFEGSVKSWFSEALDIADTMSKDYKKEQEKFWDASKLQKNRTTRAHDAGFINEWTAERKKKNPDYYNNILTEAGDETAEAHQDFIVAYYFLGDNPRLPGSEMKPDYFESARDRVAHILTQDKANAKANEAAGLDIDKIKKAKNFNELKPQLEIFYQRYGIMPAPEKKIGMAAPQTLLDDVNAAIAQLGLNEPSAATNTLSESGSGTLAYVKKITPDGLSV